MKMYKKLFAFLLVLTLVLTSVNINAESVRADEIAAVLKSVNVTKPEPLTSAGGRKAFKLQGTDIKLKNTRAKVTLKGNTETIDEISKSLTSVNPNLDADKAQSSFNVNLEFPANDTAVDKVYEISFSVDGGITFYDKKKDAHESGLSAEPVEVVVKGKAGSKPNPDEKPVPAKNPVIESIKVFGQYGEMISLSIIGKDLTGAKFKEKVTNEDGSLVEGYKAAKWGKSLDTGISQVIYLPTNNTEKEIVYKIYISIDNGKTFLDDKVVTVKLPGKEPVSNNQVTKIRKTEHSFDPDGGSLTITVTTKEDTTKDKIKTKITRIYNSVETEATDIRLSITNVPGKNNMFMVAVVFPSNTQKNSVEYRIAFNAKGSDTEFQSEPVFKATVAGTGEDEVPAMLVLSIKPSKPVLPKDGGKSNITIKGENIDINQLVPEITKTVGEETKSVTLNVEKVGGGSSASFIITFPQVEGDKAEVYNIKIGGKSATVTVGGRIIGTLLDILPSRVYTDKEKKVITVFFDEDIFAVESDYKALKNGITLKEKTDNKETERKLTDEDKVVIEGNRIVITLAAPFEGKINSRIEIDERLIKDSKGNEARKISHIIEIAKTIVNSAEFIKGEVLTNKGGDLEVRLVGEGFMKEVLGMKAPVNTLVKVLENNKSKTELYGITTKLGKKVNDDKIKITTNEEGTEQIISFALPSNETGKTKTYSVMVSLDGGLTYSSALGVNILENRAKRLVASVLPTDKNDGKPSLSFMSITSYGTQGGGKEEADITHTETPNGQESKKTWVTAYGANLDKSLTKIRIIDRNGIIWYPLQNEGTSDSTSNFIMVSSDGTGIFGSGNTQMLEVIGMNNIATDETFTYQLAVDGKNYDTETVVTVKVPYDGAPLNTKKQMTEEFIRNVKVSHVTSTGKVLEAEKEVRGYSWSKLRSFGIRAKEFANCKVLGYRKDGSDELTPMTGLNEGNVENLKSVQFVYEEKASVVEPTTPVSPSIPAIPVITDNFVENVIKPGTEIKDITKDGTPLGGSKENINQSNSKKISFSTSKETFKISKTFLKALDKSERNITIAVKNGEVTLSGNELKNTIKGSSYLKIVKKNNAKEVKKALKSKKHTGLKAAYGKRLYEVKLVVNGKNITKTASGLTISLKAGKIETGSIYVLNLKSGKKIKAKYDKKTKSVVFSTKELGKFVVTLKK